MPLWLAEASLTLTKAAPVHLSFRGFPGHVAVLCNERNLGLYYTFGDVMLGTALKKGKNTLKLLMWGDISQKMLSSVKFHSLGEVLSQNAVWQYRPWEMPREDGPIVGKDQPAWYKASFKCKDTDQPVFLHVVGAKKGQLFLNRHNVGRFWTVGPQQHYYLPACWLGEKNELLLFSEGGNTPTGSKLHIRPLGPFIE